jgi:RNA polymerase sigma-70 factor (ECF subfamily)
MSLKPNYTDEELLQLISGDDQDAFTMIYDRYWQELFVTAVKALRSRQEAEDVLQDVFLSLWRRRKELIIEESLSAYLHTSIRYKAIHYIEKNIHRRDYLDVFMEVAIQTISPSADIQLQLKEVQEAIRETVAKMPPKMQEVYHLSRGEHLSHREIAEKMGISVKTVKKHSQRAVQVLKTALNYHTTAVSILLFYFLA